MAGGAHSAGMKSESAELMGGKETHSKHNAMVVDGGGSCPPTDSVGAAQPMDKDDDQTLSEVIKKGDALKEEGNSLFKQHQFSEAVVKYTAAIDAVDASPVDPRKTPLHVYLCNRAFAHLRMENFGTTLYSCCRLFPAHLEPVVSRMRICLQQRQQASLIPEV